MLKLFDEDKTEQEINYNEYLKIFISVHYEVDQILDNPEECHNILRMDGIGIIADAEDLINNQEEPLCRAYKIPTFHAGYKGSVRKNPITEVSGDKAKWFVRRTFGFRDYESQEPIAEISKMVVEWLQELKQSTGKKLAFYVYSDDDKIITETLMPFLTIKSGVQPPSFGIKNVISNNICDMIHQVRDKLGDCFFKCFYPDLFGAIYPCLVEKDRELLIRLNMLSKEKQNRMTPNILSEAFELFAFLYLRHQCCNVEIRMVDNSLS